MNAGPGREMQERPAPEPNPAEGPKLAAGEDSPADILNTRFRRAHYLRFTTLLLVFGFVAAAGMTRAGLRAAYLDRHPELNNGWARDEDA